jgi:RimJ/RimL family protein N-acetyltransferase
MTVVLVTEIDGLVLRELLREDLEAFTALVERNRAHLPEQWEATATPNELAAYFDEPWDDNLRLGIRLAGELIGRVDLNPIAPPNHVLGYWLDVDHRGRGYATAACRSVVEHARRHLDAAEIYAGVTHGNDRSVAVLDRLGFEKVDTLDTYDRYRLVLS